MTKILSPDNNFQKGQGQGLLNNSRSNERTPGVIKAQWKCNLQQMPNCKCVDFISYILFQIMKHSLKGGKWEKGQTWYNCNSLWPLHEEAVARLTLVITTRFIKIVSQLRGDGKAEGERVTARKLVVFFCLRQRNAN